MFVTWNEQCKNYMEVNYSKYLPDNDFADKYFWSQLLGLLGANWWSKVRAYEIEEPDRRFDNLVISEMLLCSNEHMDDIRKVLDVFDRFLDLKAKTPQDREKLEKDSMTTCFTIDYTGESLGYEEYLVKRFWRFYDETTEASFLTVHNDLITRCFLDDLALFGLGKILHASQYILRDIEMRLNQYSSAKMTTPEGAAQVLMGRDGSLPKNINLVKDAFCIANVD